MDVKAFFEQVSARWDDIRSGFYNADVIDALAVHGRVTPGSRVADAGTGTGFVAAGLAGEQAGLWLGFAPEQVAGFVQQGRLAEYGYSSLGMQ